MAIGTTIQIFLPYGNLRSLKIAEITSRTVWAIPISTILTMMDAKALQNKGGEEILKN